MKTATNQPSSVSARGHLRSAARSLPTAIVFIVVAAMLGHGVIVQPAGYHDFADHSVLAGFPHAADVFSNIGFALVAMWGVFRLAACWNRPELRAGQAGYKLFLAGLFLTAFGSAYYHLAPDDFRLVWDRLPIALACAGLLAAVRAETVARFDPRKEAFAFGLLAIVSVGWWHLTNGEGQGDLRPYLLLQLLPIALIPLWQWLYRSDIRDRRLFGAALAIYVIAKLAELNDHAFLLANGLISGHTLKHLLATLAAGLIVFSLTRRVRDVGHRW